jgi:hypothetical protein
MALILLGNGLEVVIDKYLIEVPPQILYWVNILSAVLICHLDSRRNHQTAWQIKECLSDCLYRVEY